MKLMRFITLLSVLPFLFFSCLTAQPRISTGTKNKKAQEAFDQALAYLNFNQLEKAEEAINAALRKDAKYLDALMLKGDILKNLKRFEESIASFNEALRLQPALVEILFYRAESEFTAMRYAEAKLSLETFLASPGARGEKKEKADFLLIHATFAAENILKPVPFDPKNMGPNINTSFNEYFPGITADDQYFIFTRRLESSYPHEDFFLCQRLPDGTWGPAYNLGPPVNTNNNEGSVSISTDGQFIFFAACDRQKRHTLQGRERNAPPEEIYQGCDLYYTKLDGDKWAIPRHLGDVVNSNGWESTPSLSFDGLSLYFASTRPGGFGGSDIWMSRFEEGKFLEPVNLGPDINTPGNEQTPFIHPDDQTLYFASNHWPGFGDFDFFYSRRNEKGAWSKPINMGYPINTSGTEKGLLVNRSGDLAYFSSRDRSDGFGGVDIYSFELYPEARPKELSYVKAVVVDDETSEPLQATAELLSLLTGTRVIETSTNSKTGSFLVVLQANQDYALSINKMGYLFHSENFSLKSSDKKDPFTLQVRLKKVKKDESVVLHNVFFDVESFELKPESRVELNKLAEFLNLQPSVKIEISGHTDNTGLRQNNITLSENRAKAVRQYLIEKGINANRLSFKGYADTKPIADNNTEVGRQKNRRTEYRVIEN